MRASIRLLRLAPTLFRLTSTPALLLVVTRFEALEKQ